MLKQVVNFEEKHHVLEVDGIEYEIPQRTKDIEDKLIEHDKKLGTVPEYESNIDLLEILFGAEAVKTMFPDIKTANLDKISLCARYAIALYRSEQEKQRTEKINEAFDTYKPIFDAVSNVDSIVKKQNSRNELQKVVNKKK